MKMMKPRKEDDPPYITHSFTQPATLQPRRKVGALNNEPFSYAKRYSLSYKDVYI